MRSQYKRARLYAVGPDRLYLAPPGWAIHTVLGMELGGSASAPKVMDVVLHQVTTDKAAKRYEEAK